MEETEPEASEEEETSGEDEIPESEIWPVIHGIGKHNCRVAPRAEARAQRVQNRKEEEERIQRLRRINRSKSPRRGA